MTIFDCCAWCKYYDPFGQYCIIKNDCVQPKTEKCDKFVGWTEDEK